MLQLPLPDDIIRYAIVEYLRGDEYFKLQHTISNLSISPRRVSITTTQDESNDFKFPVCVKTSCTTVVDSAYCNMRYYMDDILYMERNYAHGIKHGIQRSWYSPTDIERWLHDYNKYYPHKFNKYVPGTPRSTLPYVRSVYGDSLEDGVSIEYWPDGSLKNTMYFEYGKCTHFEPGAMNLSEYLARDK